MLLPLLAQYTTPVPVNGATIQLLSYVTNALNGLIAPTSTIFLGAAMPLLNKLGLLALVLGALKWTWDYLTGNHIFSGEVFWKVLVRYLIAYNLLRYYNTPLPLIGYNVHQLFTEEGRWMAAQINTKTLDLFLAQIQQIWGNMEKPHIYDIPATMIYVWIGLQMATVECALFIITALSFWAVGIGIILGPFFIVSYLFQGTRHFFWAWVNFMVKYSLYRVVAACIVAIFSNILVNFISNTIHGDYSLGHWWAIAIAFFVICITGVFACLKVGSLVNDLTTGSAYAGSSIPVPMLNRWL
jgi:type IV secretion system protein VirB6